MRWIQGGAWSAWLEPVDPLLRIDPALQVADLDAARLGLAPRVERLARPAELIIDDAEVDQRLGWVAAEALHRTEVGLAERQRGAVHRDPALDVAGGVLLGGSQRPAGGGELAGAPLVDRDRLPARREQLLGLVAEARLVEQP